MLFLISNATFCIICQVVPIKARVLQIPINVKDTRTNKQAACLERCTIERKQSVPEHCVN